VDPVTIPPDACPYCGTHVYRPEPGTRGGRRRVYCSDRCRYAAKTGSLDLRGRTLPAWQVLALRAGWAPAHEWATPPGA
jgi:hypothetical protein